MWQQTLYVLACIGIPILWGVFVNWLFDRLEGRGRRESSVNDYQI